MEQIVRRGGTFYLTPEGHYTIDGRMLPMRGVIERLAPLAAIYLVGVSYDPFVSKRLSMLYRIVRLPSSHSDSAWRETMTRMMRTLAAIRPVTTSQLLGGWLASHPPSFTRDDAVSAVASALRALPPLLFVDPELRRSPRAMVSRALPLMVRWGILEREGDRYRLAARRRHPQFPFVEDVIAYQERFLEETIENASYACGSASERVRIRRDEIAPTADQRL